VTSIRMNIALQLVTRLATIPGWNVQLRARENVGDAPIAAVVFFASEEKQEGARRNYEYVAKMTVGVFIKCRAEDADATLDGGNPYRYLDRQVVLAEKKIHDPDEWGLNPGFTDVFIEGHEVADPDESNEMEALLRLTFTYKHNYQDPEA
jgi:hypothetical protein